MIIAAQIRAARGLLSLSQTGLSELASISVATVKRVEAGTQIRGSADTFRKIQEPWRRRASNSYRPRE
jgi:transcriptional regulator with XRE-family HTH domain